MKKTHCKKVVILFSHLYTLETLGGADTVTF